MALPVFSARNPRTGVFDYQCEQATIADLDETCRRLRAGQPAWAALGVEGRLAALSDFAAAVDRHKEKLFEALKTDTGRVRIARLETGAIGPLVARITADARAMLGDLPEKPTMVPHIVGAGQFVPYGLMGNITPWNFPLLLSFIDTVPSLAAGNAVIIKPSEVTPRWVEPIRAAIRDVPALDAVLALVRGPGDTGAALIDRVDLITFTGSVRTGRKVAEAAARRFIPAYLELGGKDPAVVLASANLEAATSGILRASVAATGQACQSLERVYVARPIYDAFVAAIVAKAQAVTLDLDDAEGGFVGPFIFERQADIVADHLKDAVAKGAKILCGGQIVQKGGKWLAPPVVVDVTHKMKLMTEETFGPVIPIMPFDTVDEAVALANDTIYGLSASVYAGTPQDALPVARRLNGGAVSINDGSLTAMVQDVAHDSFGYSGMGPSRFGPEGILRYVRRKALLTNTVGPMDVAGRTVPLAG
ncbi:MAG: aldehyde dehydrogenase family protein [Rhodospirillaceae bacterium]|nr:aldehyde dehydrogenase family protein [Rhodospirillaceae bacterium]